MANQKSSEVRLTSNSKDSVTQNYSEICTAETVHIQCDSYIKRLQKAEPQATKDIQPPQRSPSVRGPETHNSRSLYDRNPTQLPPTAPFLPFQTAIDRFFEDGDNDRIL